MLSVYQNESKENKNDDDNLTFSNSSQIEMKIITDPLTDL